MDAIYALRVEAQPAIISARAPKIASFRWLRALLVFTSGLAFAWWWMLVKTPSNPGNIPDFTIFHAAGAPGPIYDPQWLTAGQQIPGQRPFAYPPTFLLICRPLHLLPLGWAYALWIAVSATLFVEATGRLVSKGAWLVLASPMVLLAGAFGQTPLFIGALTILSLSLPKRPILAGVLLGIAFSIKPQVILFAPVALAIQGQWRALFAMGVTGAAACLASLALGPELWSQWFRALPGFAATQATLNIRNLGIPMPFTPFAAAAVLVGLCATRRSDLATRLLITLAGSLIISPHALAYETAMLAPPALAMLLAREWRSVAVLPVLLMKLFSPWAIAACIIAAALPFSRRPLPFKVGYQA